MMQKGPPGCLLWRMPPATGEIITRTNANFRELFLTGRGALYEDDRVVMHLSMSAQAGLGSRQSIAFEVTVLNRGSCRSPLHDVGLRPLGGGEGGAAFHDCELRIEAVGRSAACVQLGYQQQCVFRGRLDAFGPFGSGPRAELSYFLNDAQAVRVVIRLPFAITCLMAWPAQKLQPKRFLELWHSPEFQDTEMAIVCAVRRDLLGASALRAGAVWRCLEMGGTLCCVPGLFGKELCGMALASSYPERGGKPREVLVRAELRGLFPERRFSSDWTLCHLSVRSASHLVNQALLQALVDVLCDPAPPLQAAAGGARDVEASQANRAMPMPATMS